MARRRIRMTQFQRGLWVNGARDQGATQLVDVGLPGYLRRARGINSVPSINIHSRAGDALLYASYDAHSLYRFADVRWFAVGTVLYRDGIAVLTSANGNPLSFVRMPPSTNLVDYLFVTGGDTSAKIDRDGNVSEWGITPPSDGFTATLNTVRKHQVHACDSTAGFTATNCVLSAEATIKQEGTNSFKIVVAAASTVADIKGAVTKNLTVFDDLTTPSSDQDYITAQVRMDGSANVEYMALRFDVGAGNFASDYYTAKILPTTQRTQFIPGLGTLAGSDNTVDETADGSVGVSRTDQGSGDEGGSTGGDDGAMGADATWSEIRIPKKNFARSGTSANGWDDVVAFEFIVKTNGNGGATVYLDDVKMKGGAGMAGSYSYLVTFRNTVTGARSNANPTPVSIYNNLRQAISLANLPISSDPQVDQREVWRTVGNGARYWRCLTIDDNVTTTATDNVADFIGLDNNTGADVLEATELPTDNLKPIAYIRAWGPFLGRVWWLGDKGLVFYSPPGRPESNQGFVILTNEDDLPQQGVIWNATNYVFTERSLYRIDNTTEPFIPREVFGTPGTVRAYTVVPTPYGIVYQALDGIRIFTGTSSQLVAPDAVQNLCRGESSENLTGFDGVVATYANDEYIISDLVQTLAVNLRTGRWRDLGIGCTAFYHEPDTNVVLATVNGNIVALEQPGIPITDLAFEVQTGSTNFGTVPTMIERIYVDALLNENELDITAIYDNEEVVLGTITAPSRALNLFNVNRMSRTCGIRATGALSSLVDIYGIDLEVRTIPLYILEGGRFFLVNGQPLELEGNVIDLTTGISYYAIEEAISLMNVMYVPEIRRLYVDVIPHGETITPQLDFYGTAAEPTLVHPASFTSTDRRIVEWDVNVRDRLIALHLLGDFTKIELFQVGIDVHLGRTP